MSGLRLRLALIIAVLAGLEPAAVQAAPSLRATRLARFDGFLAEAIGRYKGSGAVPQAAKARQGYANADLTDPQVVRGEDAHVLERYASYRALLAAAPGSGGTPAAPPRRPAGSVAPEDIVKGVDDGRTDAAAAIQKALATGDVWLTPGRRYLISHGIAVPANRHIASDGTGTIVVGVGGSGFPDRPFSASGVGSASTVFVIHDAANVSLQDFRIQTPIATPGAPQPMVQAIDLQNVDHAIIAGLELRGFPRAPDIIRINSSGDVLVADNLIHGSYTRTLIRQLDALSVDADRVFATPGKPPRTSDHIVIRGNFILGLVLDAGVYLDTSVRGGKPLNNETTGIYVGGHTNGPAQPVGTHAVVSDNVIADVGQGIDLSASDSRFSDNHIERASEFALKMGHGASRNQFDRFTIVASGGGGVIVYSIPTEPAADNHLTNFTISYPGAVVALPQAPSFGIMVETQPGANRPAIANNTGNVFDTIRFDHLPADGDPRWLGMIVCTWPKTGAPGTATPNQFHNIVPANGRVVTTGGCGAPS